MMAMHIPPHEDWSPELLSELQRAVPILESSNFDLREASASGASSSRGNAASRQQHYGPSGFESGSLRHSPEDLGEASLAASSSSRGGGGGYRRSPLVDGSLALLAAASSTGAAPRSPRHSGGIDPIEHSQASRPGGRDSTLGADPLSDHAMSLPLTTLTSGKRRTYPNRSTFQAHVCCVMDATQVDLVVEKLRMMPEAKSVGHWSYTYRIISPFSGELVESFVDDGDVGAGEKMLGLLTRLGLENLLLAVSRWDSGLQDRLGNELFKCVILECKELLQQLQQAVRASFPPHELLKRDHLESGASGTQPWSDSDAFFNVVSEGGSDLLDRDAYCFGEPFSFGATQAVRANCPVNFSSLGPSPPPEVLFASRGVCTAPKKVLPSGTARSGPGRPLPPLPKPEDRGEADLTIGVIAGSCPLSARGPASSVRAAGEATMKPMHSTRSQSSRRREPAVHLEEAPTPTPKVDLRGGLARTAALEALGDEDLTNLLRSLRRDRSNLVGELQNLAQRPSISEATGHGKRGDRAQEKRNTSRGGSSRFSSRTTQH